MAPEPRASQTLSQLLDDRRIIDTATEANEPPSLVVHLLEKEWTMSTGRAVTNNQPPRRFSYGQPISNILDDIQARRVPVEFAEILKQLKVKFFEGCLLVEMHDSRPTKSSTQPAQKTIETKVDKYVLRPSAEIMWSDIKSVIREQNSWGDKEALELESRIVLSTAPPLCLDPSPTVNRIVNTISRSGAYAKTAFKRKTTDDADDDVELVRRRKLMLLMNPRAGKQFTPTYSALRHKDQNIPKHPQVPVAPPPAKPAPPVAQPSQPAAQHNQPTRLPPNAPPAIANNPGSAAQMAQATAQLQQHAALLSQRRLLQGQAGGVPGGTGVPANAQIAAVYLQQKMAAQRLAAQGQAAAGQVGAQGAQNPAITTQLQLHAQAQALRAAAVAQAQAQGQPAGAAPMQGVQQTGQQIGNINPAANQNIKMDPAAMAQLAALQNGKQGFSLTLPSGVKRTPAGGAPNVPSGVNPINPAPSPPKPSATPVPGSAPTPAPGRVPTPAQNMGQSAMEGVQQTPRMQNATPVNPPTSIPNAGMQLQPGQQQGMQQGMTQQNSLANYHASISGQQNQMQQMHAQQGYPQQGMNTGGMQGQMAGAAGQAAGMQNQLQMRAQLAQAYAMNPGLRAQHMAMMGAQNGPNQNQMAAYQAALQQQQRINMAQQQQQQQMGMQGGQMAMNGNGAAAGMQYGGMAGQPTQAQQQNARLQSNIQNQAIQLVQRMSAAEISQYLAQRETDQHRAQPGWMERSEADRVRMLYTSLLVQQYRMAMQQAQTQQQVQAQGNMPR